MEPAATWRSVAALSSSSCCSSWAALHCTGRS